jgi:hypothetical protein
MNMQRRAFIQASVAAAVPLLPLSISAADEKKSFARSHAGDFYRIRSLTAWLIRCGLRPGTV